MISSREHSGQSFRIAVIEDRNFSEVNPDFTGRFEVPRAVVPVGQTKEIEVGGFAYLKSIYGGPTFEIKSLTPTSSAILKITHLKSCPVIVSERTISEIKNTGSGVIAVPKIVKKTIREWTKPACETPEDRVIEQSAAASSGSMVPTDATLAPDPHIVKAQAAAALEDKKQEVFRLRERRAGVIREKLAKLAVEIQKGFEPNPAPTDVESQLRGELCPSEMSRLKALGLQEIQATKVESDREVRPDYTSINYKREIIYMPVNGEAITRNSLDARLVDVAASISFDPVKCLKFKAPLNQSSDRRAIDLAAKEFRSALDWYERYRIDLVTAQELRLPTDETGR